MARKPAQTKPEEFIVTAEHVPLTDATPAVAATNMLAAVQADYSEERDLLNQLLGQAQMAGAFEEFSRTVRTSKLAFVKENKLYRALAGRKTPHGAEILNGTWEEFCNLLGRSVDQVDRDISNLRTFGEEALESMSRMGIGYRELRQFRRLPEDQKTALIEVAKAGDKESFVELAEELIAKHTKEKEELTKRVTEVEANYEQQGELIGRKDDKINDLEMKLRKQRVSLTDWPAEFQGFINQVMAAKKAIEVNAGALDIIRTDAMSIEAAPGEEAALEKARESLGLELSAAITRAEECIAAVRHVFDKTLGALIEE
jgi:hypothetical protein